MDRSYIIRIYKQENETVKGIVEDVQLNKREKFSNANQLWSLIVSKTKNHEASKVVKAEMYSMSKVKH